MVRNGVLEPVLKVEVSASLYILASLPLGGCLFFDVFPQSTIFTRLFQSSEPEPGP